MKRKKKSKKQWREEDSGTKNVSQFQDGVDDRKGCFKFEERSL
jgi:hypothetical protein